MDVHRMIRDNIKRLWPCLVLAVGLWLVCAVLAYQWVLVMDAKYRVNWYPRGVAESIVKMAISGGGQVLVSKSGNREASLLVAVPAKTVAEIESYLSKRHERIGSELSMWENSDSVLVNVALDLSESQAAELRGEIEGQLTRDVIITIVIAWFGAAMFIWLGVLGVSLFIVMPPSNQGCLKPL